AGADDDEPAHPLSRLHVSAVTPEAAPLASLPRPEEQGDDESEPDPGAAHHPPEEARDVLRRVALGRERALRASAASGERRHGEQGQQASDRSARHPPTPLPAEETAETVQPIAAKPPRSSLGITAVLGPEFASRNPGGSSSGVSAASDHGVPMPGWIAGNTTS